jgi:hypothetical protein
MQHTTEIVRQQQTSDEIISVTVRCCGDSATDSTRSIHVLIRQNGVVVPRNADEIQSDIDGHHDEVAAKHAGMVAGKGHILNLTNTTKTHMI